MASELGGLFENCQKETSTRTALADMGHLQPPTPVATNNKAANRIVNGMAKQKKSSNRHEILLAERQNPTKPFEKKNLADYVTKHHPIWHHRAMRPRYVKAIKKL